MQARKYTQDIPDEFEPAFATMCDRLEVSDPKALLSVFMAESGMRADAHNDQPKNRPPEERYNAVGINQLMPATLKAMHYSGTWDTFRHLNAAQQLTFVELYFTPYRGKLTNAERIYIANFLPARLDQPDSRETVIVSKRIFGWAYAPNASFDSNGDLVITQGELGDAIHRATGGPRWDELVGRVTGEHVETEPPVHVTGTVWWIQDSLRKLGINPGPIDGIPGRLTRNAVAEFQAAHEDEHGKLLVVDGIVGPHTMFALRQSIPGNT